MNDATYVPDTHRGFDAEQAWLDHRNSATRYIEKADYIAGFLAGRQS